MIGTLLGIYKILEKIRDGGAGTVWKAQAPKGDLVAIKMISEAWNEQRDRKKAFKREAEITQKLAHPAIIRLFAYCEGPPRPYLVMEYFPSDNLKFALWRKGETLQNRRMWILKQAAEGLAYLHSQGLVHRDVKPENFLVNSEGSVRLIDFSIAQTKGGGFSLFGGKKVDGTPLYMSPEQIRNESPDPRMDLYSFGITIFELMTRRPPFIGASVESILQKHLKDAPPSMRSIVKEVPDELDGLVTKMLAKRPADRPSDMSFVLATLNRLAKREEEARGREGSRGPTQIVDSIGQAGATPVPAARPSATRPTPGAVPAVGAGAQKPPSNSKLPAIGTGARKPPTTTSVPAVGAGAQKPPASSGVPAARDDVSRAPTKVRPPGSVPLIGSAGAAIPPAAAPIPTKTPTKRPPPVPAPSATEGDPSPPAPAEEGKANDAE